MAIVTGVILPFGVYWLILFAACYMIVEFGQGYLYDEATPAAGIKVAIGSAIMAAMLTWSRTSYENMFTHDLWKTALLAIAWFGIFTLVFQFQPWHGFGIGLLALAILAGAATLVVDSMMGIHPAGAAATREVSKPLRRSLGPSVPAVEGDEASK